MIALWFALNGIMAYIVYSDCLEHTQSGLKALLWALPVFVLGATTFVLGVAVMLLYLCITSVSSGRGVDVPAEDTGGGKHLKTKQDVTAGS